MTVLTVSGMALAFTPRPSYAQKKQRDRLTREEILSSAHKDRDIYQVIRSLKPHFLAPPRGVRSFGGSAAQGVSVYVEGKRDTGLDALQTLMARDVEEVRYLDPTRSENEFGPQAKGGAVVVKLYKDPRGLPISKDATRPPPS